MVFALLQHFCNSIDADWTFSTVPIMHCCTLHFRTLSSFSLLTEWICSSDYPGSTLWSVPTGSGVSDQVLGHTGWNWQKDMDSGAREALPVRHHEAHRHRYRTHGDVYDMIMAAQIRSMKPVSVETVICICRKQCVHQSGGRSQTSRDAAGLLPAGSWAR